MEYIVKITPVKEKIQGYLSIYIGKTQSHLGQKEKKYKYCYISIYIGNTIQISLYRKNINIIIYIEKYKAHSRR